MTSTFQKYLSPPNLEDHPNFLFSSPHIYHDVAATSSSSSRNFLSLTADSHDENYSGSYYNKDQLHHPHDQGNFASNGGSCEMENDSSDNGLKFSIWKKADDDQKYETHDTSIYNNNQKSSTTNYQVKWMSNTKMRLMQKMKNTDDQVDPTDANTPRMSTASPKLEDRKEPVFSDPMETDNSSNTTSSNNLMMSNINHPIRVCSDCNTTKTPLWRSGPQGPKSLCNACGIRQRKARRAMAEAAAAANGTTTQTETKPVVLIKKYPKAQKKDKTKRSAINGSPSSVVSKFKNRGKMAAPSTDLQDRKICLEDFLLNLSKNLAFYTVFPQDEKEAAILLMALSFGHVHG